VQRQKPIADRDSAIQVELTLIYPPFRTPANLETKSCFGGDETGLMKKEGVHFSSRVANSVESEQRCRSFRPDVVVLLRRNARHA